MSLDGKVAIITGCASGIGRAMARTFCAQGARVLAADRDQPALDKVVEGLVQAGHQAIASVTDVTSEEQVAAMVDSVFSVMATTIKKEGNFSYPGFGSFTVRKRKARQGRNPQTGETIKIKASKTVGFKPAKALKDRL